MRRRPVLQSKLLRGNLANSEFGKKRKTINGKRENLGLVYREFCLMCRHHVKGKNCSTTDPF